MPHFFERINNRSIEGNILKLIFDGKGEIKSLEFDLENADEKLTIKEADTSTAAIGHYDNLSAIG